MLPAFIRNLLPPTPRDTPAYPSGLNKAPAGIRVDESKLVAEVSNHPDDNDLTQFEQQAMEVNFKRLAEMDADPKRTPSNVDVVVTPTGYISLNRSTRREIARMKRREIKAATRLQKRQETRRTQKRNKARSEALQALMTQQGDS